MSKRKICVAALHLISILSKPIRFSEVILVIARLWLAAGLALATISTSVLEAEELQSERGMVPGVNYVRTTGERIWMNTSDQHL